MSLFSSDIDECMSEDNSCDINANCVNQEGSYVCVCMHGFDGSGNHGECQGIVDFLTWQLFNVNMWLS